MNEVVSIILAAGQGKRMQSDLPKVLHTINNKTLADYVIDCAEGAGVTQHCIVVGHEKELVQRALQKENCSFAVQETPLGTGHAVASASELLRSSHFQNCLILCGDTPCLKIETIQRFIEIFKTGQNDILVLSTAVDNPAGYGRIIRDTSGALLGIREEKDCSPEEKKITEINTGIYLGPIDLVLNLLGAVDNQNSQGEYYLTDIIELAISRSMRANAIQLGHESEFLGVNSQEQLQWAHDIINSRIRR